MDRMHRFNWIRFFVFTLIATGACGPAACSAQTKDQAAPERSQKAGAVRAKEDAYRQARNELVREIERQGVGDPKVLAAMRKMPRHLFVPKSHRRAAYRNHPLPIGHGQTISQPYIVAFMTEKLAAKPEDKVLEIGTGSGYQAAVLAELIREVYTIEIVVPLGKRAAKLLEDMDYKNIHVRIGDGYKGWPDQAPFDAIIVTCAPDHVPQPLVDQLKVGGRMCIPVGPYPGHQELYLLTKLPDGKLKTESILPVRFVPLTRGEDAAD